MNKELLYTESSGIRLISDSFDIVIDPISLKEGSFPDAIVFSSLKTAASCDNIENTPAFAASGTKNLLVRARDKFDTENFYNPEEIISCTSKRKSTIRIKGTPVAELTFFSKNEFPASSHILLKTKTRSILYTTDVSDKSFKMPPHDTLIIYANKKTPAKTIISKVRRAVIKVESFTDLSSVLCFFNEDLKDISVGVDSTLIEKVYEYLKADCTVFSSSVKPLSSFRDEPHIIITADETQYTDRFCMFSSDFQKETSLAEIYEFSKASCASVKLAICPGLGNFKKRGDIFLCTDGSVIDLQDFECCDV